MEIEIVEEVITTGVIVTGVGVSVHYVVSSIRHYIREKKKAKMVARR